MSEKNLHWHLLQEAKKEDYSKYGKNLIPGGRYSDNLKIMIQQIKNKTGGKVNLASEKRGALFKNLGVSKVYGKSDWLRFFNKEIAGTEALGELIAKNSIETKGNVATIQLVSDWPDIAPNENQSRRFIAFWLCEILKAMGFTGKSRITMTGFQFFYQGNNVSIIRTKE